MEIEKTIQDFMVLVEPEEMHFIIEHLIKNFGVEHILSSLVAACDSLADEATVAGNRKQGDFWRSYSLKIFDVARENAEEKV